ncbi:hypothetical protein Dimus_028615, partial [Dionaea muscipula]
MDVEKQADEHDVVNADLEEENVNTTKAAGGDNDDDEDNMLLSSRIEALRRGDTVDEDDVVLSLKYQVPQQDLIKVDAGLEVVGVNTAEMEVEIVNQNLSAVDEDEKLFGIDDVDAFIDIVVKKIVGDIFEDIANNVDMDLAEEVVKEIEGDADKEKAADAEPKMYRRRRKARKSKRRLVILESDAEEEVDAAITPQDDVVLTTSRDMDVGATGMEIVVYQAPSFASNQESSHDSIHGERSTYVDMSAHIEQAVKCLLSAIKEQSSIMKNLLKHLEHTEFLNSKAKVHIFLQLEELINSMDGLIKTVADSLRLIGDTVKDFSDSVVKKLSCLSVENQNHSKIIEHKIQL